MEHSGTSTRSERDVVHLPGTLIDKKLRLRNIMNTSSIMSTAERESDKRWGYLYSAMILENEYSYKQTLRRMEWKLRT